MAAAAQVAIQNRKIEVNRVDLVKTLEENKVKHIREYEEAKSGYRNTLLAKLGEAYNDAKKSLEKAYSKQLESAKELSDDDIAEQEDYIRLFDGINIVMKVPRSYAKEYDAAIGMAKWDVRQTLELTYAEFNCFVRDEWDWKMEFSAISKAYNNAALGGPSLARPSFGGAGGARHG